MNFLVFIALCDVFVLHEVTVRRKRHVEPAVLEYQNAAPLFSLRVKSSCALIILRNDPIGIRCEFAAMFAESA